MFFPLDKDAPFPAVFSLLFPQSESKVLPRLAIEGRIVAFSLDTTVVSVVSFT